ncbi:hypothetical protein OF001_U390006 [Pseudomonas sp. OF001]|nr:hypothetical protein OF001_U390006 [Pseudomonas sp. OF001]
MRTKQIINIDTKLRRINWVESVLCINERTGQTLTLRLCNNGQSKGCFTRGLRTVNFNNTTTRKTANTQGDIQAKRAGRDNIDIHRTVATQPHDGAFTKLFLDLTECRFKSFAFCLIHIY